MKNQMRLLWTTPFRGPRGDALFSKCMQKFQFTVKGKRKHHYYIYPLKSLLKIFYGSRVTRCGIWGLSGPEHIHQIIHASRFSCAQASPLNLAFGLELHRYQYPYIHRYHKLPIPILLGIIFNNLITIITFHVG